MHRSPSPHTPLTNPHKPAFAAPADLAGRTITQLELLEPTIEEKAADGELAAALGAATAKEVVNEAVSLEKEAEANMEQCRHVEAIYSGVQDAKMNSSLYFLTRLSLLCIPVQTISGWYGMNFESMPELKWKHGYLYAFGLTAVSTAVTVSYFKRKKWL